MKGRYIEARKYRRRVISSLNVKSFIVVKSNKWHYSFILWKLNMSLRNWWIFVKYPSSIFLSESNELSHIWKQKFDPILFINITKKSEYNALRFFSYKSDVLRYFVDVYVHRKWWLRDSETLLYVVWLSDHRLNLITADNTDNKQTNSN